MVVPMKRASLALLLSCSLPLAAGGLPGPGAAPAGPADADQLQRVLDKAQRELEAGAAVLEDHSTWENGWDVVTRDYSVHTALNWYIGRRLGSDLEAMLGHFRELTRTNWRPPARLRVFLYPSLGDYNAFANEFGATHSSLMGGFWARDHAERPVAVYHVPGSPLTAMWATHAAFHQFVEQAFPNTPQTWISEGLASYFGIFFWDARWGARQYRELVDGGRFIPLRQLMREQIDGYGVDPGNPQNADPAWAHARFVQLGAMFNYLLHFRADTRTERNADGVILLSPAADYINDLLRGRSVVEHPMHELFTTRLDELEADLRAFDFGT